MKYTYFTLVLLIILSGCKSTETTTEKLNDKQDWVNYLFQNYMGEKPSASFIVIKDGKTIDCQSFGYADLENKILANCETNYRIGSVTKQFTAMGALILINQGKLNYDTKLTEVIPEFPDYGKEITLKDLLLHRSGLESYNKLNPEDSKKQLLDKDVLNLLIEHDSLLFPANSKFRYSNSGYAILALIIERTSGKTFKDFMDKEIFEKIGMTNSTVYLKDLQIKNRALGYKFNDTIYENKDQNTWSAIQGDGGIYSSVSDYQNWDKSLYDETLIKTELKNDAFSNWDENGKNDKGGYGFGWGIEINNNIKYLVHSGSTTGFRSFSLRIPSEKITIAIYTNSNDNSNISKKGFALASLYSDNKSPMPIDLLIEREISINGSKNIKEYYSKIATEQNKDDGSNRSLTSLAWKYLDNKENANALELFEIVKVNYPKYLGGYYGLGRYYQKTKEKQKALEYFNKVIELATKEEQGWSNNAKKRIKELSE